MDVPEDSGVGTQGPDHLTFDLADSSKLSLSFYGKRPGPGIKLDKLSLQFALHETRQAENVLEAYERLIHDAICGDQTLFTDADGIERLWELSMPLLEDPPPVQPYAPGSWGPESIHDLVAPQTWRLPFSRGWRQTGLSRVGKPGPAAGVGLSMVPLSVLDLATVGSGQSAAQALAETTRLARVAERLGYRRLWVAERHGMPAVASSSPAVFIGHLAAATQPCASGPGASCCPTSPLVIAEQFGTLEALHPGRIDLGLGRAPGTDRVTARALRRTRGTWAPTASPTTWSSSSTTWPRRRGPAAHPRSANPGRGYLPKVWLLGSSVFSTQLAGVLGLPFSFAYHFSPGPRRRGPRRLSLQLPPFGRTPRAQDDGGGIGDLRPDPRGSHVGWLARRH